MWLTAWVAWAADLDDGFVLAKTSEDCNIESRPRSHPEGSAMRASCTWPEVDAERLGDLMVDLDRYEELVFALVESEVREDGPRQLVYQRQSVFGISDREVLLWVSVDREPGRTRVEWEAANDRALIVRRGAIRTPRNVGFWQITARPEGGASVVHEIAVEPGGSIPQWIVRLVRTRGFVRVMREIRKRAGSTERPDSP